MAGTAAPLNPAYREDEFRFYLEDTAARVLILPPNGAEEARRAAGDGVPILTVDWTRGMVRPEPALYDCSAASAHRDAGITPPAE